MCWHFPLSHERSAAILQSSVQPALSSTVNPIDKCIRLVLTESGPMYKSLLEVETAPHFRRVGNMFYTHGFAELLRAEVMVHHARVRSFLPRLVMQACAHNNELTCLFPGNKYWWPLVEDIFSSPASKVTASEIHCNRYIRTLTGCWVCIVVCYQFRLETG
jgi:hypothetical protein